MNIKTFKSQPPPLTIEQWQMAPDSVLLKGNKGYYFVTVLKSLGRFSLFIARPSRTTSSTLPLLLNCGCQHSNQAHWHYWEDFETAELIVEATARVIQAVERGRNVKLANSIHLPR